MFSAILVSLDGSALAEKALAPACSLASKYGSQLTLLRVVPPERSLTTLQYLALGPNASPADPMHAWVTEAEAYLTGIRLPLSDVPFHTQVLVGAPPEMIVATASNMSADLIVMSTHGRSGLTRLLYGSVAEAVLRGSPVPVLLVPNRVPERRADDDRALAQLGLASTYLR